MKHWICLIALVGIVACTEKPPFIDLAEPVPVEAGLVDTSFIVTEIPSPQDRVVFIEDFSGVQCVNCPKGNAKVAEIVEEHPGRVIGLTLHAGEFAVPFGNNISKEEFVTEETVDLDGFLGIQVYPSITIDRHAFNGEVPITGQFINTWNILAEERLEVPTPVNLTLSQTYNEADSTYRIRFEAVYTQDVADEAHNYSIFLAESGIIDAQLSSDTELYPPNGLIREYVHDHVVRDMITPSLGNSLTSENLVEGLSIIKEFKLTLDENWVADNMEIIAIVHNSGELKEIIQAKKIGL